MAAFDGVDVEAAALESPEVSWGRRRYGNGGVGWRRRQWH